MSKSVNPRVRKALFKEQNGKCHYCGCQLVLEQWKENSITLDHVIPKCLGGTRDLWNVVGACLACNSLRGNMDYQEFKRTWAELTEIKAREYKYARTLRRAVRREQACYIGGQVAGFQLQPEMVAAQDDQA